MRIVKEGEVRRKEFIDTAVRLFIENGYDRTSIASIIEAVGVTKGAFYHYFKSKEEILDAVTDEYTEKLTTGVLSLYNDPQLSALEKLEQGFLRAQSIRAENSGLLIQLFGFMNRDENLLFNKRFLEKTLRRVKPAYERMIYQGVTEGVFNTDFPEEAADLIIRLGSEYRSKIARVALQEEKSPFYREEISQLIAFLQDILERILGMERDAINLKKGFLPYLEIP